MSSILHLKNIHKNFGSLEILKDVSLELGKGQSVAILGPSGAGKSTLLHISGLMETPTSGSVFIDGTPMENGSEKERATARLNKIGFLFQFHYLLPEFNVLENVLMPCRLANDNIADATETAMTILIRLGLKDRITHRPNQLSGGEQQRTALARALIRKPNLLLCDEPTGNLDLHTAQGVWDLIHSEIESLGLAALVVTHNESLAKHMGMSYHLDGQLRDVTVRAN